MTKLIVLVGFFLSFAAGLLLSGRLRTPGLEAAAPATAPSMRAADPDEMDHRGPHHGPPMMHGGFLPRELNLSDDQQQKIRQIWSSVANQGPREMDQKRRELAEKKDAAIAALLPADKKTDYQKIQSDFTAQMSATDAGFRQQFDDAVRQTEALLTDEQRSKYEEIRNRMRPPDEHDHGHGRGGPDDHGPPPFGGSGGFDGGPGGPPNEPHDGGGI